MPLNETADKTEKAVAENVKDAVPGTNSLYVLNANWRSLAPFTIWQRMK